MAAPIFQRTIVDGNGDIQPGATITVRNEADGELAAVYSDRELTTVKSNPFSADSNGFVEFFAVRGEYRVKAEFGEEFIEWRYVQLIDTEFLVQLDDAGDATPITGDLSVGNNLSVSGALTVEGLTDLGGSTSIGGSNVTILDGASLTTRLSVKNDDEPSSQVIVDASNTASKAASAYLLRSRGTIASPSAVQANDKLAALFVGGNDGTDMALGAELAFEVDGTPGSNDMPTRMVLKLSPDGSQTPAEVLRVASNGNIGIGKAPEAKLSVNGQLHGSFLNAESPANTTSLELGSNVLTSIVVSAAITLTTTVPPAGATAYLKIITSGATSRVVTFGAGFKAQATLATGTVTNRVFMLSFISDGTNLFETSRTTVIVP
jgi:hypothetical protein